MGKFLIGLAVAGCLLLPGRAAQISGVVTDDLTTAPVESALVEVQGTGVQTYTDAAGRFTLDTPSGIKDYRPPVFPGRSGWEIPADVHLRVYDANGAPAGFAPAALDDGMYVFTCRHNGREYTGKLLKLTGRYQTGSVSPVRAKSGAAVTLVYSHKYYTTKETAANEGDLNVTARLTMWWPDETTTGVPSGAVLAATSGTNITAAGTVFENKNVTGNMAVNGDNVTIRKCRIHGGDWYVIQNSGRNCLIEDCEIYSDGSYDGITGSNMIVRRCNIHGFENSLGIGSNVTIEDCYLHDHYYEGERHIDGIEIQSASNVVVRHNNIRLDYHRDTGCINITPWGGGHANDWVVRSNLFYGGTYSLYIRGDQSNGAINGVNVTGNVWVKDSYMYGTQSIQQASNITWSYNCLDDGTPVQR